MAWTWPASSWHPRPRAGRGQHSSRVRGTRGIVVRPLFSIAPLLGDPAEPIEAYSKNIAISKPAKGQRLDPPILLLRPGQVSGLEVCPGQAVDKKRMPRIMPSPRFPRKKGYGLFDRADSFGISAGFPIDHPRQKVIMAHEQDTIRGFGRRWVHLSGRVARLPRQ